MTNITGNFTWEEAACHDGTAVPEALRPNATRLALMLERIRSLYGGALVPVSWYRTPSYNEAIREAAIAAGRIPGAAKDSQHMQGWAVDVRPAHLRDMVGLRLCMDMMLDRGELSELGGYGAYPAWVHLDLRPRPATGHIARWAGTGVGSEV